jgi:hypothetical protein
LKVLHVFVAVVDIYPLLNVDLMLSVVVDLHHHYQHDQFFGLVDYYLYLMHQVHGLLHLEHQYGLVRNLKIHK